MNTRLVRVVLVGSSVASVLFVSSCNNKKDSQPNPALKVPEVPPSERRTDNHPMLKGPEEGKK